MRREDILSFTRAHLFRPFELTLTNGEQYEIRHPDMIVPTLGMVTIGVPATGSNGEAAERDVHISLVHIGKIEYLDPTASPGTNGAAGST